MNRSQAKVSIDVYPSLKLALFVFVTHGAGSLVVTRLMLEWGCWGFLGIPIVFSFIHSWRTQVTLTGTHAVVRAERDQDGGWELTTASGVRLNARLMAESRLLPRICVLSFKLGRWRRRWMILLGDNSNPGQVRRLRASLRMNKA